MPKFNANLTMLYTEHDFIDRFAAAKRDGFAGVEFLFPYDFEKSQLADQLRFNNLDIVLHNLPAGDWGAGERGIACMPDRVGEFQDGVGRAVEYATALGCPQVNCLAGIAPAGVDADSLRTTLVDNLRFAAKALGEAGVKLLVEPINTRDIPGFLLNRSAETIEILDAVGSDNAYLQYDVYHMQIMEGDLAPTFAKLQKRIAHIQIADNPNRHEPGTGEINYPFLFSYFDAASYDGWIGCEYKPAGQTSAGLGWLKPYLAKASAA